MEVGGEVVILSRIAEHRSQTISMVVIFCGKMVGRRDLKREPCQRTTREHVIARPL